MVEKERTGWGPHLDVTSEKVNQRLYFLRKKWEPSKFRLRWVFQKFYWIGFIPLDCCILWKSELVWKQKNHLCSLVKTAGENLRDVWSSCPSITDRSSGRQVIYCMVLIIHSKMSFSFCPGAIGLRSEKREERLQVSLIPNAIYFMATASYIAHVGYVHLALFWGGRSVCNDWE